MVNYMMRRIDVFKKLRNNTWDGTAIPLVAFNDIKVNKGIGKTVDVFSFTVDRNLI